VVTCQRSGEFLVIQDRTEGLYLQTSQTNRVHLGDRVDVLGFPASDERGTILQDAIYRWSASGTLPTPLRVTPPQVLSGEVNALLVRMEGKVLDHIRQPHQPGVVLQAGNFFISARLAQDAPAPLLESCREGSVLQVTGVCFVDQGKAPMLQGFSILVPSPTDLTVIQGPPRWTRSYTRLAAGVLVGLILASAAWVSSLRTRVSRQTESIRQRVEKEAALERRYRELVEDAHDLIYTHDLKGGLTSINRAGEKILGYSHEEALQLNMHQLVAPEHHPTFDRCLEETLEGHPPAAFEVDVLSIQGRRITLEAGIRPIYQSGILVGVQGIARDITGRKQSEAQRLALERNLQESQKLESLGVMAGGIAHDFNNLLTAILGNASLARMGLPPSSPAQTSLDEIEKTSLQAADLCKQMLAYSGRSQFALQRMDLSTLIKEMSPLLQISVHKKITIHTDLAKNLCGVEADPAQIRQIALNLVINGSEAIGDQPGTIRVSTGLVRIDETVQSADYVSPDLPLGEYAYLEVADTGCGMDPETKARIFEPFFTTKFTGRGLGLAAVLGIVRGHKGGFKVSTEKGRGSTLTLLLPCSAKAVDLSTLRPVREQEWRGEGTVLVVDDELGVRKVAERLLEKFGFKVLLAEDGFAAMEVFEAHADEISLVVLDLTMPRLNGQEVLRRIKALRPNAKVILMSGYTEEEVARRFSADELSGILQKPFKTEELRRKLRMALERDPARS
jgi:PAS domain S-box-containing protein